MPGMMPLLIAALIAGLAMHSRDLPTPLPLWPQLAAVVGGSLVAWTLICLVMRSVLLRRVRGRSLMQWELLAQGLMLSWFAWVCLGLGWAASVPGTLVALAPYVVMALVQWACLAAPIARITGERWSAWSHIAHQVRFSALPLILGLVTLDDLASVLLSHWLGHQSTEAELVRTGLLAIVALIAAPPMLVRILGAKPMPPGPLRDRLAEACAAMGQPDAHLMHWPVPLPRFYNAMVIGALPRMRYVVFSDDLLRDLQDRELLAVLGHELGHSIHRHLWVYMLFLATISVIGLTGQSLLAQGIIPTPDWAATVPDTVRDGLLAAIGLVVAYRLAFGVLSRACEREADLAGVRLSGDPEAMESALKTVARLSGQSETAPNWRHRSIAERVDFLKRVRAQPHLANDHHRTMRYSLVLLIAIMVASLALNYWLSPARQVGSGDAAAALQQWQDSDEQLREAIAQADGGDPTALSKWYQRANLLDRQRILLLHLKLLEPGELDPPGSKDRMIYEKRRRLTAFSGIDAGRSEYTLWLDNTLAYGLVAGTQRPTSQDLDLARQLLPNLEQAVAQDPNNAYLDTIGCVHFVLGNFTKARDAFANARNGLVRDKEMAKPTRSALKTHLDQLYTRRHDAAERNIAIAANGGTLEPLPLDWTPDESPSPAVENAQPATTP